MPGRQTGPAAVVTADGEGNQVIARGFGMQVIASDPYVEDTAFTEHCVEPVDLDTLLRRSDLVSINVVLTPETYHLIGERELSLMKPSAILVNTARGKVIDEPARSSRTTRSYNCRTRSARRMLCPRRPRSASASLLCWSARRAKCCPDRCRPTSRTPQCCAGRA